MARGTGHRQPERMTPILDFSQLAVGHRIQDPLLVYEVDQRSTGDKPFVILTLGNSTGRIGTAPFWPEDLPKVAGIARGHVVQVIGEVTVYRDRRQLYVTSIRVLPRDTINWRDLLPTVGDPTPYWAWVDRELAAIAGSRLRNTLALFYSDPEFRRQYEECPASISGHHAALGGLLKHTLEVAGIAKTIARIAKADGDLVLAGVLLHDIGKLESYRWDGWFQYTDRGHLYGHVVLGSLMLERRVRAAEPMPCTDDELDLLQHLVLSHHGQLEFGAPVQPMTLEAEVLHYADNASAKTASMAEALGESGNFLAETWSVRGSGSWTGGGRIAGRASGGNKSGRSGRSGPTWRSGQKWNGRLVLARRPSPHGLPEVGARWPPFFSHLPPWLFAAREGVVRPRLRSPGRMAIPPGSSMRALRVGSGRGPTPRTASRGARSGWMERATGSIRPSRSDHRDLQAPEPLVASAALPRYSRSDRLPIATETEGPDVRSEALTADKYTARENRASACLYSVYGASTWMICGSLTGDWRG